jgi:beta-phosphoglucomutase-like phosphatase (HAD superfamily)
VYRSVRLQRSPLAEQRWTAILFDWDGTLVDSTQANYLSLHEALAAHGHDLARDWFLARTGLTTAQTVQEYCTQFGLVVDHDRVVQQVNSAFRRHRAGPRRPR